MILPRFSYSLDVPPSTALLGRIEPQTDFAPPETRDAVRAIVQRVRTEGDSALIDFTQRFDGVTLTEETLRLPAEELRASAAKCPEELRASLAQMIENVRAFHTHQRPQPYSIPGPHGSTLRMLRSPVKSAALYVPGGTAAYPTTVVMNAVPAQIAGVERLIVLTPPNALQENPAVAAALELLGVHEVYQVGGAHAVAAAAFGTATVPRVDVIVGPGNIYVALAKREVFGLVGIDSVAGPSEVMILADDSAPAAFIAADLIAQAEHDVLARCIVVSDSSDLLIAVERELEDQIEKAPRRDYIVQALRDHGALVEVSDLPSMLDLCHRFAAEHLQVMLRKDRGVSPEDLTAGAIFWGPHSPTALGDYWAGPNHVLPTNGSARHASPLGVEVFMRSTSVLHYSQRAASEAAEPAARIADAEHLHGHAHALRLRS